MIDFVVGAIIVAVVGLALAYIIKCRKAGKCIGCPDANTCTSHGHSGGSVSSCGGCNGMCGGCSGCHADTK